MQWPKRSVLLHGAPQIVHVPFTPNRDSSNGSFDRPVCSIRQQQQQQASYPGNKSNHTCISQPYQYCRQRSSFTLKAAVQGGRTNSRWWAHEPKSTHVDIYTLLQQRQLQCFQAMKLNPPVASPTHRVACCPPPANNHPQGLSIGDSTLLLRSTCSRLGAWHNGAAAAPYFHSRA